MTSLQWIDDLNMNLLWGLIVMFSQNMPKIKLQRQFHVMVYSCEIHGEVTFSYTANVTITVLQSKAHPPSLHHSWLCLCLQVRPYSRRRMNRNTWYPVSAHFMAYFWERTNKSSLGSLSTFVLPDVTYQICHNRKSTGADNKRNYGCNFHGYCYNLLGCLLVHNDTSFFLKCSMVIPRDEWQIRGKTCKECRTWGDQWGLMSMNIKQIVAFVITELKPNWTLNGDMPLNHQ